MLSKYARAFQRRTIARTPIRINAKPDFVIIGAMKSGTTSLFAWLSEHPDVIPASRKELHFFDAWHGHGIGRYWVDFPLRSTIAVASTVRGRRSVTGEATPEYLLHPSAAERMSSQLPDVKLIVLLRDPVERAISHYWHSVRAGLEPLSLEDALAAEPERMATELERIAAGSATSPMWGIGSYVTRGLYAEQLRRWQKWYPRPQILLLRYEDLAPDPRGTYRQVLEFIGLDVRNTPDIEFRPENVGAGQQPTSPATTAWLRSRFRIPNAELADQFGIVFAE